MAEDEKPKEERPWQFKPGRSGNPGGRPKGIERIVRETIASMKRLDPEHGELDGWRAMTLRLFKLAMGDIDAGSERDRILAAKFLFERAFGTAKQSVKITGEHAGAPAADLDAQKMSDAELREALAAIATLKRLSAIAPDASDDAPTEH